MDFNNRALISFDSYAILHLCSLFFHFFIGHSITGETGLSVPLGRPRFPFPQQHLTPTHLTLYIDKSTSDEICGRYFQQY